MAKSDKTLENVLEQPLSAPNIATPRRNDKLVDIWSAVHLATGTLFGWIMAPAIAFIIMAAWEPLEIFVLSPLLAKFGITFGYEALRNSLSDIFFNTVGIIIGLLLLRHVVAAPFHLF